MSTQPEGLHAVPPPPPGGDNFAFTPATPSSKSRSGIKTFGIIAGLVVCLAIGLSAGVFSQAGRIKGANDAAAAAQAQTAEVQSKLAAAQSSNSNLQSQVSNQQSRLSACSLANSLSVKMDGLQHKLVSNALTFGSLIQWGSLEARYKTLGHQWATAANMCDPSGGYTFG